MLRKRRDAGEENEELEREGKKEEQLEGREEE